MKRKLILLLFLLIALLGKAQQNPVLVDSLKMQLSRAKSSTEKVELLGMLARILMNTNLKEADQYGKQLNEEAELSRDRKLMFKALMVNGERYSYFSINKDFVQKSISYYNQALNLAKQNDLDKERAEALLSLSAVHRQIPELDQAFNYTNQAFSLISTLTDNDSLEVAAYISFGNIYQSKKNRLLALRNYLNALPIAEEIKHADLLRLCYYSLSQFYAGIKDYDKAIDFAKKAMDQLSFSKASNTAYNKVVDLYYLGNLYVSKKDFDMSVYFFEKSLKLADSLNYEPLKMPAYNGLLNQHMRANQPQKALEYFNNSMELKRYLTNVGFGHVIDNAYAVIYTELGKYDSAKYYFEKAAPRYETSSSLNNKLTFYVQYAEFYDKSGNSAKAVEYYMKAKALADQTAELEWQQRIAKELDTAYAKTGDFKQSYYYSGLYQQYKDSLQKLGEEKDLMQMELADEQQRQARIEKERLAAEKRRHDIQYTAITIGIAAVFLILVLLGAFRVSVGTIKVLGFFAFIMLFEFIILIADYRIHSITHGEPWKVLAIKIILIAMLLPLHHWTEHKVVSYLASQKMIMPSGKNWWKKLFRKTKITVH